MRSVDFHWIVFHPPGLWVDLGKLTLRNAHDIRIMV
ncbi:Uncharacterised protein [Vibrio cholerae]|nr:Uncharacterised protein [Vibrio cholerae]